MDTLSFIRHARGSVMNKEEFVNFITIVHRHAGNYAKAADALGDGATPPTVRRVVVKGQDSDVLRKILDIKKSDRMRQCFECTSETKHNIRLLRDMTELSGEDLLEEMVDALFEKLEGTYHDY